MININLQDKVALVTGAGSGIGRAVAVELGRSGACVVVNYHFNEEGARQTLDDIEAAGGTGWTHQGDVSKREVVAEMLGAIGSKAGRLDVLVNNAGGLVRRCKVAEMPDDLWDEVMDINLRSTFLCCQAAIPLMSGRGWGRIINMSTLAAHDGGGPGAAAYAASKAAVVAFTKGLAKEVAGQGITVNCVAPGLINTAFHDVHSTPQARQGMVNNTPLAREGQPLDVADPVLFLASDLAAFITGETININGGQRMS